VGHNGVCKKREESGDGVVLWLMEWEGGREGGNESLGKPVHLNYVAVDIFSLLIFH
jgi:hypothetical protein